MSRRIKRTLSRDDRREDTRRAPPKFRDDDRVQTKRAPGHRPGGKKPPRVFEKRRDEQPRKRPPAAAEPARPADTVKTEPLPTKVQTVVVTPEVTLVDLLCVVCPVFAAVTVYGRSWSSTLR